MSDAIGRSNSYTNNNIDVSGAENLRSFLGYNQNPYIDPAMSGWSFVFVTKPALFIEPAKPSSDGSDASALRSLAYGNMCADPKLTMYITGESTNPLDKLIIHQLSFDEFSDAPSLFLPIFTNMCRGFSPSDVFVDTVQSYQTKSGYSIMLPTTKIASEAAGQLSITVGETANLDFMKMLGIWVNYIAGISDGTLSANPEMINGNMIDYMSSIYYFVLSPDGQTIKYWCKYTGCYPTSIPYSSAAFQKDSWDAISFDVPFQYAFKEDMNPEILQEFNMLSLKMVAPMFTDAGYSDFERSIAVANSNGYISYSGNELLDRDALMSGDHKNAVAAEDRDPLVFFRPDKDTSGGAVTGALTGHYELSFGSGTLYSSCHSGLYETGGMESIFDYDGLLK
jgi:hypothetical protein